MLMAYYSKSPGTLDRLEPALATDTKSPEWNTSLDHVPSICPALLGPLSDNSAEMSWSL